MRVRARVRERVRVRLRVRVRVTKSYPRSSIRRVTKLGRWSMGMADGAVGAGLLTGTQWEIFPDVTFGTGPCSCGSAVRRHVCAAGLKVNPKH